MGTTNTDNFARVAATLGANWSQLTGLFSVNNGAIAGSNSVFNLAKYIASAFVLNQQISFTIGPSNADADQLGVAFRITTTAPGVYSYYFLDAVPSGLSLKKVVGATSVSNGTVTGLQNFLQTMNPGDVVTLCAFGPNLVVFINGVSNPAVINITDSTIAGEDLGVWVNFTGGGPVDEVASWSGKIGRAHV